MPSIQTSEGLADQISVTLDGRQLFYLFLGGAVVVSLVFALGVVVGQRTGAVGETAATYADDPLAALDELYMADETLAFQDALVGGGGGASEPLGRVDEELLGAGDGDGGERAEDAEGAGEDADGAGEDAEDTGEDAEDTGEESAASPAEDAESANEEAPSEAEEAPSEAEEAPSEAEEAQGGGEEAETAAEGDAADGGEESDESEESEESGGESNVDGDVEDAAESDRVAGGGDEGGGGAGAESAEAEEEDAPSFVVQAGAFQSRAAADSLFNQIAGAGHAPTMETREGESGEIYRIILGPFDDRDAAAAAMAELEPELDTSPYVSQR